MVTVRVTADPGSDLNRPGPHNLRKKAKDTANGNKTFRLSNPVIDFCMLTG